MSDKRSKKNGDFLNTAVVFDDFKDADIDDAERGDKIKLLGDTVTSVANRGRILVADGGHKNHSSDAEDGSVCCPEKDFFNHQLRRCDNAVGPRILFLFN